MDEVTEDLDRMRQALAGLFLTPPLEPGAELLRGIGAPPQLRPGTRIRDPITGQDGEVIGYGRASVLHPAAGAGGR